MDAVYCVRKGDNNEELRYSLRSIAKNLNHDKVYVGGYTPSWIQNVVSIDFSQPSSKHLSAHHSFFNTIRQPELSEDIIQMNDDFFVLKKTKNVEPLHLGPPEEAFLPWDNGLTKGSYYRALIKMVSYLKMKGIIRPKIYETHTPMVFNRKKLLSVVEMYQRSPMANRRIIHFRTLYGNIYNIGGEKIDDVKVETLQKDFATDGQYFSTNDNTSRREDVQIFLDEKFPKKCRYEK